jgi:DNA-binding transcriptional MocR family regulator
VDSVAIHDHDEEAGRWRALYARRLPGMQNDPLAALLGLAGRHDIISFAGGLPDPTTFRVEKLSEAARQVMLDAPGVALQYGPTPGLPQTREWFCAYLARHEGVTTAPEAVMVTSGGVEALDLLNKISRSSRPRKMGAATCASATAMWRWTTWRKACVAWAR